MVDCCLLFPLHLPLHSIHSVYQHLECGGVLEYGHMSLLSFRLSVSFGYLSLLAVFYSFLLICFLPLSELVKSPEEYFTSPLELCILDI
jgi:hypothetical protein